MTWSDAARQAAAEARRRRAHGRQKFIKGRTVSVTDNEGGVHRGPIMYRASDLRARVSQAQAYLKTGKNPQIKSRAFIKGKWVDQSRGLYGSRAHAQRIINEAHRLLGRKK